MSKILKDAISEEDNFYGKPLLNPTLLPKNKFSKKLSVSIVIPAYNSQQSILACLTSIEQSGFNINHQNKLEVIVVDDGSEDKTWKIIKESNLSLNLIALRQNKNGQAQALNTGLSVAENDIVISCDSDMVLGHHAIEHFMFAHNEIPNALFAGFRQYTNKNDPRVNPDFIKRNGNYLGSLFSNDERFVFPVPGWPNNMCLASDHFRKLGNFNNLLMPDNDAWLLPDMVIGALFSLRRSVFKEIGGYDERLIGWGCTDAYLAAKAIGAKQYIIPLYTASGLHINHPVRLENRVQQYKKNRKLFFKFIEATKVNNHPNWLINAKSRIIESIINNPKKLVSKQKRTIKSKIETIETRTKLDQLLLLGQYKKVLSLINFDKKIFNEPDIQLRLSKALSGINQYKKAIYILKNITSSRELLPCIKTELAINQAAEGQFESAQKTLNELSKNFPQTPELLYWQYCPLEKHIEQGQKFFDQGFYQIAIRCFEAASIIDPLNKVALKYRNLCIKALF
jgi:glycosyltransferase involved in cell wall biosynthesis